MGPRDGDESLPVRIVRCRGENLFGDPRRQSHYPPADRGLARGVSRPVEGEVPDKVVTHAETPSTWHSSCRPGVHSREVEGPDQRCGPSVSLYSRLLRPVRRRRKLWKLKEIYLFPPTRTPCVSRRGDILVSSTRGPTRSPWSVGSLPATGVGDCLRGSSVRTPTGAVDLTFQER